MKLYKIITVAVLTTLLSTSVCYADYELGNVRQFHSFENYSSEYNNKSNPEPEGFVYVSDTFRGRKGYYIDEERKSKTFKLDGYNTESFLKFGAIVDSGMMHVSYDIYQGYDDDDPMSKGKTLLLQLSRTAGGNFTEGWYHGEVSKTSQYYDQYDPEAINHATDAYQSIIDHGKIIEYSDDADPVPYTKGPLSYYNDAIAWGRTEAYDPDKVIDWRKWYKMDIYFNKDNNTYAVYLNGELAEGQKYDAANGVYTDKLAATLNSGDAYKAIKGVFFRAKTTAMQGLSNPNAWHKSNGGFFLLDNVYAKSYTGSSDVIALLTDDLSGQGVALTGGTLNVAFSEYMAQAASKSDIEIKNILTGEQITDFEISNSDNMQFAISFGETALSPGQYEVNVSGIKGKITGQEVAVPAYFDTAAGDEAWVCDIACMRNDGVAQERSADVTSATTAVSVEFTEAVDITSETAPDYFSLKNAGDAVGIKEYVVSDDFKTVTLYPEYLFVPGSEYRLTVSGGLTTRSGNELLTNNSGNAFEGIITVANDPRCDYTQMLTVDDETETASFSVDVIKTDTSKIKYTMVAASYADTEDEDGNIVPKLIDIQYIPISIDEDERVLKKYITESVDCTGADRVKAFIWDYPSFNNIFVSENTIE